MNILNGKIDPPQVKALYDCQNKRFNKTGGFLMAEEGVCRLWNYNL